MWLCQQHSLWKCMLCGSSKFVTSLADNAVKGMASLAMLLPFSAAYANDTDPVSHHEHGAWIE
jgi:hypothetical protein